jgi:hypothetical protein
MAAALRLLSQEVEARGAKFQMPRTGRWNKQTTNARKREGSAVECGLIVIPTVGQRYPTSVE